MLDIDRIIEDVQKCRLLPEGDVQELCFLAQELLIQEANIQLIHTPVTICGDIHGQFWDLLELLRKGGEVPETSYVFMARLCSSFRQAALLRCGSGARGILWTEDITVSRPCLYYWS